MAHLYFKNNRRKKEDKAKEEKRLYAIDGHSIMHDKNNFYLTIPKAGNEKLTDQDVILNDVGLLRILDNCNLIVLNGKQLKKLPKNAEYTEQDLQDPRELEKNIDQDMSKKSNKNKTTKGKKGGCPGGNCGKARTGAGIAPRYYRNGLRRY